MESVVIFRKTDHAPDIFNFCNSGGLKWLPNTDNGCPGASVTTSVEWFNGVFSQRYHTQHAKLQPATIYQTEIFTLFRKS